MGDNQGGKAAGGVAQETAAASAESKPAEASQTEVAESSAARPARVDVTALLQEGAMKLNERTDLMAEANAYVEERRAEKNDSAEREKERELKQHASSIPGNSRLVQKTFSETVSPNVTVGQRNPVVQPAESAIVPSVLKPSAAGETPARETETSLLGQQTQEINQSERARAMQGISAVKGWVYVISNKAMPGLVKVGFSMKDPELRARELDHTGAPHPYAVDYEVLVDEPYSIEQGVHRDLSAKREGREWFRCTAEEAIAAITYVTKGKRHIETFKRAKREEANRVAEERKHAEELERAIAEQVAETTKRICEEYERETARQFPEIEFSPYWLGWGFVFLIAFYIVFDPVKHDLGTWIAATIAGAIAAVVHTSNTTEKRKKSPAYLALTQKKDMAIQEAEQSIRRARPGPSVVK